jgi:transposase-like protein
LNEYGSKKPRKREAAALALISSQTITEAAQAAGISESTLYRWRQEPEFQAIISRVKAEALDNASNRLAALSTDAVSTLQEIAGNKSMPPTQRVSAARAMLETAFKLREQDEIISRLENLEKTILESGDNCG